MTQVHSRRCFIRLSMAGIAGSSLSIPVNALDQKSVEDWNPKQPFWTQARSLKVQPIFMYSLPTKREETSWRSWGGIQTEEAVLVEIERITSELSKLKEKAEFPVNFLPVIKVKSIDEARKARSNEFDVALVYACTGGGELLKSCFDPNRPNLIFVRHRSGPIYYWYEALSVKYLQTTKPGTNPPLIDANLHVDDVVVDDSQELLWRLRALFAIANLRDTRVIALGGAWGKYSPDAPKIAQDKFGIKIMDVSYDDLAARIQKAHNDRELMKTAEQWVDRFLSLPKTSLKTQRSFVTNAFVLYRLFKDIMQEQKATAFTIKSCMGTVIPMSKTTACLSLGLINDEGGIAFCESDFVVVPVGILLRYIANKPVFMHNSTFPHQGIVTCAHCSSPRRLDGKNYEPTEIVTHYESDYGAAPKVEMPIGQIVTFLNPEYSVGRWTGMNGIVRDNPNFDCCRSQQDIEIVGNWRVLLNEVRDSHWMMVYGDYVKESRYAARKLGTIWNEIPKS